MRRIVMNNPGEGCGLDLALGAAGRFRHSSGMAGRATKSLPGALEPLVLGELADHPEAVPFAREVLRVHKRYATEIVAGYRLCPFLRDVETGLGRFFVMLDRIPNAAAAADAALAAEASVIHLVYPCTQFNAYEFERFGANVSLSLKRIFKEPPVIAVFHPDLSGDATNPHRLVGLLRRAPDPFVQLVPEGLHEGGTTFAGFAATEVRDTASDNFQRLMGGELEPMLHKLADIHADRNKTYAPYLAALTP